MFVILLEVSPLNRIDLIPVPVPDFCVFNMPTAIGKAWYRLRSTASKLARMEHRYTFLKECCEENLIPHGLNFKNDVGLRLYPWMLEKYSVGKHAFISHRIQELASDAYIIMTDLHADFCSVKSDVQRRFRAPICNPLFKRARAFLNYERRQLKSREQLKLYKLHRSSNTRHQNSNTRLSTGHINSLFVHPNQQCSQSKVTLKSTILIFFTTRMLILIKFLLLI